VPCQRAHHALRQGARDDRRLVRLVVRFHWLFARFPGLRLRVPRRRFITKIAIAIAIEPLRQHGFVLEPVSCGTFLPPVARDVCRHRSQLDCRFSHLEARIVVRPPSHATSVSVRDLQAHHVRYEVDYIHVGSSYTQVVRQGEWWRALSASFSHISLMHLAFNMMSTWALRAVRTCAGRRVGAFASRPNLGSWTTCPPKPPCNGAGRADVRHGTIYPDDLHFRGHHPADSAAAASHARSHAVGRAKHAGGAAPLPAQMWPNFAQSCNRSGPAAPTCGEICLPSRLALGSRGSCLDG
jgi:hypothetical protein